MKPPAISLAQIAELGPACYRRVIPASWADRNGHMNMRHYVAIYDDAGDDLYLTIGLTPEFHRAHNTSTFDLEHHTHFLREVHPGDAIAVYVRPVARTAKRIHYLMFLVNETRSELSSLFECVNTFADLSTRRSAPYPPALASTLDAWVARHAHLSWPAPVCGAMSA